MKCRDDYGPYREKQYDPQALSIPENHRVPRPTRAAPYYTAYANTRTPPKPNKFEKVFKVGELWYNDRAKSYMIYVGVKDSNSLIFDRSMFKEIKKGLKPEYIVNNGDVKYLRFVSPDYDTFLEFFEYNPTVTERFSLNWLKNIIRNIINKFNNKQKQEYV